MFKSSMNKSILVILSVVFIFSQITSEGKVYAAQKSSTQDSVLMLYDASGNQDHTRKRLSYIYAMLRIYNSKVKNAEISNYNSKLIRNTNCVVIVTDSETQANKLLLQDLRKYTGTIIFIGPGVRKYSKYKLLNGIKAEGTASDIGEIKYRFYGETTISRIFTGDTTNVVKIHNNNSYNFKTYGYFLYNNNSYPYAVNRGKLWVISFYSIDSSILRMLNEILARAFNKNIELKKNNHCVYVKFNEVSPLSDLDRLEKEMKWMDEQGLPFIMELTPVFLNYDTKQMQRFAKLIRQEQEKGNATAVMGNLEGYHINDVWDEPLEGEAPLSGSESMAPDKLMDTAIKVYINYGIYPVAISTSQDVFFDDNMQKVIKHFSTFINSGNYGEYFEQVKAESLWKGKFIYSVNDENKDYILKNGYGIFDIKRETSFNDFQFYMKQFMKDDFQFLSLRQINAAIKFKDINIKVSNKNIFINGINKNDIKVHYGENKENTQAQQKLTGINARVKESITFVIALISIFVITFFIALVLGKRIDRKKHMR